MSPAIRASLYLPGIPSPAPSQLTDGCVRRGVSHAAADSFDIAQASGHRSPLRSGSERGAQLALRASLPDFALTGSIAQMPVRSLLNYWPLQVAPGARVWIDQDIFAGTMGPIVFETHLTPGMLNLPVLPDEALSLTSPDERRKLSRRSHPSQRRFRQRHPDRRHSAADFYRGHRRQSGGHQRPCFDPHLAY